MSLGHLTPDLSFALKARCSLNLDLAALIHVLSGLIWVILYVECITDSLLLIAIQGIVTRFTLILKTSQQTQVWVRMLPILESI